MKLKKNFTNKLAPKEPDLSGYFWRKTVGRAKVLYEIAPLSGVGNFPKLSNNLFFRVKLSGTFGNRGKQLKFIGNYVNLL